ncbi:hypothetical protein [Dokdonella fugitiva]|jgi:hypothetical protein|uniref:Pyrroloquinoline-quinone binding quinoprotein n=1 Tax=Dokdonella fugitiva TaxID=328517 RepID=A0A4R2IGD4_9GAMM|nr:hypothetical protein [Dokdonella fugitiva]TCO43276.1 hypothetical protein EV148_101697 [Dokdonella fugitiva]
MRGPIVPLVFALASLPHAVHAGEAPLLAPQWIARQTEDQLVYDRIASSAAPATIGMPDGSVIAVTTANREIVLRRYAADGSVARTNAMPVDYEHGEFVVRASIADDALYVLAGNDDSAATLTRFDASLEPVWSVSMPAEAYCSGEPSTCLHLEVLGDGSVVAMRAFRTMRVGSDGQVLWSASDPAATYQFGAGDLAVGADAVWVATSGGSTVTLARYDFDGMRLSADVSSCTGCGASFIYDVDATSDGGARIAGSIGGHGLYARYDALGFPLMQVTADARAYTRIDADGDGATYVLATGFQDSVVRRIDPSTGDEQWSLPANDFTARDAGVFALRFTPERAIEGSAIDPGGTAEWTQSLGTWSPGWNPASHPADVGASIAFLVADATPSDDRCAAYPRIVRIDAGGDPYWFAQPCRTHVVSSMVWALDARAGVGVLVDTLAHLALYSPDGDLRWRSHACEWCADYGDASMWVAAALAHDGGAWAIRWNPPSLADPDGRTLIERYDAQGNALVAVDSLVGGSSAFDAPGKRFVPLPGPSDLVMLFAGSQSLYWQHVADDGSDLDIRAHPVSDQTFYIDGARRLVDGSVVVLTKGWGYCGVGCPPFYVTVLHIAQDGDLISRRELPETYAPSIAAAVGADGDTVAILPHGDDPMTLRRIHLDGSVDADIPLDEAGGGFRPEFIAALDDGSWLVGAYPWASGGSDTLWRIDAQGHVLATRHEARYLTDVESTAYGIFGMRLVDPGVEDAVLLDPLSLADRARFYNGTGVTYGPRPWRMLDDGSVYGTITLPQGDIQAVARYSVPGTTPSDVIFRNAFD